MTRKRKNNSRAQVWATTEERPGWCPVAIVALLSLVSGVASAGKVAIAPVEYTDAATGELVSSAAAKVETKLVEGVEEAGHQAISGQAVLDAIRTQSPDSRCDASCLGRVGQSLGADEVLVAKVEDTDQISYAIEISFWKADKISELKTDGFFVVLEWVKGAVALALKDLESEQVDVPTVTVEPASAATEEGPVEEPEPKDATREEPLADQDQRIAPGSGKLPRTAFVASAIATVGIGVTFLLLDGVSNRKYNLLEDEIAYNDRDYLVAHADRIRDDMDTIENLQTAEKVFLGLTIAGAVTTGVLAIFTDFSAKGEKEEATVKTSVTASPWGAGLAVGGRF